MVYNAFMSYSHAADGKLAPALHAALHRFAKPWFRLRALNIFRDKTNLPINPALWSSIKSALNQAEYFILLASPKSAASIWVHREIQYWLQGHPPDRVLIVLTDGALKWDPGLQGFDQDQSDALPQPLMRAFAEEPLYLDLRWAKTEIHLSVHQPRFRDAVADIAATLLGRPKDELVGEDIRQHRRTRNLAWSAIAALLVLTLSSLLAAYAAYRQRNIAETQRAEAVQQSRIALSRQLAAQSAAIRTQFPEQLPLAVLLAVESTRRHPSFEGNQALRAALTLLPQAVRSYADENIGGQGRIRALAFSPDGSRLAVARDDGTADLIELNQQKALKFYPDQVPETIVDLTGENAVGQAPGDQTEMTSLAFGSHGRLLATGSNDRTARVWEIDSGRELLRTIHDDSISSVAFSPAGNFLATGSKNGKTRVLEIATGRQVLAFEHAAEVREVMFTPDGLILAAISTDGGISLSNLASREVLRMWHAGVSGLGLVFSRDGSKLATANGDFAFVWEAATGKALLQITHENTPFEPADHLVWVDDVAFSPDGNYLASGGRDGTARIWDLSTARELIRVKHAAPVQAVAFSPDGAMLSTASYDGTARLWELPSGHELLRAVHPGGSEVVAFSPNGKQVASGGMDGAVKVWNLTQGDQIARMPHPDKVKAVSFSPDGNLLATAYGQGYVRLWTLRGEPKLGPVKLPVVKINKLLFSANGTHLVAEWGGLLFLMEVDRQLAATRLAGFPNTGSPALGSRYLAAWDQEYGALRIWETAGGHKLTQIKGDNLWKLTFDSTGTFLAGMQTNDRGNGTIRVWALPELRDTGVMVPVTSSPVFALGPQGHELAVEATDPGEQKLSIHRHVDVWDTAAARRIAHIPQDKEIAFIAFDPSGELLLTSGRDTDRELEVWDLPTGNLLVRIGHAEGIDAIRFSSEKNILATLSHGSVTVWNLATGELLSEITSAGYVRDVRFSPDGRYLLTGSDDHTAVLWLWKTEDLKDEACRRLQHNLLSSEWKRYLGDRPYRQTCPDLPAAIGR